MKRKQLLSLKHKFLDDLIYLEKIIESCITYKHCRSAQRMYFNLHSKLIKTLMGHLPVDEYLDLKQQMYSLDNYILDKMKLTTQ